MGDKLCNNCKAARNRDKQEQAKREDNKQYKSYEYDFSNIKFDTSSSWFEQDEPKSSPKSKPQENVTVKCLFCKQDFKRKEFRSDFICHQCYVKKNKSEKPPIKDDTTKTYYKAVFCFECGHSFTHTYTEITKDNLGAIHGNCPQCKASYIRTVT